MAGGLFSRLKVWIAKENLLYSALNAEFNNIIQNLKPDKFDDYQATVSQMQETQSPGTVGSEVQATSLAQEIKQLRYMLDLVIGGAQWYSAPPSNITLLNAAVSSVLSQAPNRLVSGRVDANSQPMFLTPAGSAATATLKATATDFSAFVNGVQQTADTDIVVTGLTAAPSSNNTCLVNDVALAGAQATKTLGERGTVIPIDNIGSAISALNGQYAAFKISTEVFLGEIDTTNNQIKNCYRGFFFDSTDAWIARVAVSDNDPITLLKLTWFFYVYSSDTSSLDITYNNPRIQYTQPTSPSIGDYWLDLSTGQWKKYSGFAYVAANAVLAGITAQDTTNCIAARSFDFANPFNKHNTVSVERVDAGNLRSSKQNCEISVYGTSLQFNYDHIRWSMATDRDSGVSDSANTYYWAYITPSGDVKLSDVAPHDRSFNLLGDYHPAKPWRCVAAIQNDGSSDFSASTLLNSSFSEQKFDDSTLELNPNTLTGRIKDLGVTSAKLGPLAVTTAKIDASAVTTAKIAGSSVTPALLSVPDLQFNNLSGDYSNSTATFSVVTSFSYTVTSPNSAVHVSFKGTGVPNDYGAIGVERNGAGATEHIQAIFAVDLDGTIYNISAVDTYLGVNQYMFIPPSSLNTTIVGVAAGAHTIRLIALTTTPTFSNARARNVSMQIYER